MRHANCVWHYNAFNSGEKKTEIFGCYLLNSCFLSCYYHCDTINHQDWMHHILLGNGTILVCINTKFSVQKCLPVKCFFYYHTVMWWFWVYFVHINLSHQPRNRRKQNRKKCLPRQRMKIKSDWLKSWTASKIHDSRKKHVEIFFFLENSIFQLFLVCIRRRSTWALLE